jgi:hypothetical protein
MIRTALATALIAAAAILSAGTPAAGESIPPEHRPTEVVAVAGTPTCVGNAEYEQVENGWRLGRVHRVFDIDGRSLASGGGIMVRQYPMCDASGFTAAQVFYVWTPSIDNGAWLVYKKDRF